MSSSRKRGPEDDDKAAAEKKPKGNPHNKLRCYRILQHCKSKCVLSTRSLHFKLLSETTAVRALHVRKHSALVVCLEKGDTGY